MANGVWRSLTGESWTFDPLGAAVRVIAVAAPLAVGVLCGRPLAGVLIAGGAFTIGFGAPLDLLGSRSLLLAVATVGVGASAVAGALAGTHVATAVLFAMVMALACGLAVRLGPGPAWAVLQCGLATAIATSYPASFDGAVPRALLIMAGGFVQTAVLALAHSVRVGPGPPTVAEPIVHRHALYLSIGLGVAVYVERTFGIRNGYWVPLTTLLVLRPDMEHTLLRIGGRIAGTIGGASAATAILKVAHPAVPVFVALVAVAAFGAYAFHKARYGLFATCVTSYVVFLLSFAGQSGRDVAIARTAATALGAAIALGVHGMRTLVERAWAE